MSNGPEAATCEAMYSFGAPGVTPPFASTTAGSTIPAAWVARSPSMLPFGAFSVMTTVLASGASIDLMMTGSRWPSVRKNRPQPAMSITRCSE